MKPLETDREFSLVCSTIDEDWDPSEISETIRTEEIGVERSARSKPLDRLQQAVVQCVILIELSLLWLAEHNQWTQPETKTFPLRMNE